MRRALRTTGILALLAIAVQPGQAWADAASQAAYGKRLFQRLAGVPLLTTDSRSAGFYSLIAKGDLKGAAGVATGDDGFLGITLRDWAAVMANKDGSPLVDFDDFQASVIGVARDDLDARTLLTGDFAYRADASLGLPEPSPSGNDHYKAISDQNLNLRATLKRVEPQWAPPNPQMEAAGVLTSRAWAALHYSGGTNRRSVAFSMQIFLCSPILTWRNASIDDYHIRRDVNRVPGGDPSVFQTTCRACHGPMDGFGGAFAHFNFDQPTASLMYMGPSTVAPKYNQNANTYPDGWITTDDSWVNLLAGNPEFGWRAAPQGQGIAAFGNLLASSAQFSRCMATRAFKEVCRRDATGSEQALIQTLATGFENGGYRLKSLFQDVAVSPACLGAP